MKGKILNLTIFSLAFALIEAAVVVYLRQIFPLESLQEIDPNRIEIFLKTPFIVFFKNPEKIFGNTWIINLEKLREIATLVVIASISLISGKNKLEKFIHFFYIFSLWDLGYYLFLKIFLDWPKNIFDLDIFFLVPFGWLGPVILPLTFFSLTFLISLLFLMKTPRQ